MTKSLEGFSGYSLPPFKRLGVFFAGIWQDFFLIFLGGAIRFGFCFWAPEVKLSDPKSVQFLSNGDSAPLHRPKNWGQDGLLRAKNREQFLVILISPTLPLIRKKPKKVQKNSSGRFHDEDAVWFSSIKNEPMMMTGSQIILVQKKWWGNYAQGIPGYRIPSPEKYNEPVVNFEIGRTGSRWR